METIVGVSLIFLIVWSFFGTYLYITLPIRKVKPNRRVFYWICTGPIVLYISMVSLVWGAVINFFKEFE